MLPTNNQGPDDPGGGSDGEQRAELAEGNRAELFLSLLATNQTKLQGFVHTLVRSREDAEEICQNTVLVLWRKFDDFDPSTNFFAWAARVAQYEVLNHRRDHRRKPVTVLDADVLEAVASDAVESMSDLELQREALRTCLQKLPQRDRDVVRLRYEAGGNIHKVAEMLGRSAGHAQRVLRQVRGVLLRCVQRRLAELDA